MDFALAKQTLVALTRDRFGERVTIRPMVEGRIKVAADPGRAVMQDIAARFDFLPDMSKLGGSNRFGPMLPIARDNPTVTIPAHLLAWSPDKPDRIERANGEVYEIERSGGDGAGVAIFYLSKV